ncbi:hypothetical protein [Pseudescherichia sp.]|uniref:hypothetical protein n=1 Tax=Pseudescherichia sp. TaxID=2055881 RepID=UPI0028AF18CA|nr:hypothetical protein [Pseudescherichia sp.]
MGDDYGFANYGVGGNSLSSGISNGIFGSTGQSVISGTGTTGTGSGFDLSSLSSLFGGKSADGSQSTGLLSGGLGALQGLANMYLGFQSYGLAKDQLAAQQQAYKTNLANSVQSYNTSLEDKIRGRTSNYDGKEADVQSYLASHKLST